MTLRMSNVEIMVPLSETVSDSLSIKTRLLLFIRNHETSGVLCPLATQVNVAFSPRATAKSSGAAIIIALAVKDSELIEYLSSNYNTVTIAIC